jgi:hypothetical protein
MFRELGVNAMQALGNACMVHYVELMSKYKSRAPPRLSHLQTIDYETTRVQGNWTHGQSLAEKQYVGLVPSSRRS